MTDAENLQGDLLDGEFRRLRLKGDCAACSRKFGPTTPEHREAVQA